jgi:two-component system, cell cycle sensor histidine kinase and response regulator CckA
MASRKKLPLLIKNHAVRVVAVYLTVGLAWIFLSDYFLVRHRHLEISIEVIKGSLFVIAVGILLYLLIERGTQRLQASEEKFSILFYSNPIAIALVEMDSMQIQDVNDAFVSWSGISRKQLTGQNFGTLPIWSAPQLIQYLVQAVKSKGVIMDVEVQLSLAHQKDAYALYSCSRVMIDNRWCLLASLRDITDKKQTEVAMTRLTTAMEQVAESIVITDSNGQIQYANWAFERLSGLDRAKVIHEPIQNCFQMEQVGSSEDFWTGLLQRAQHWSGRITKTKGDGAPYQVEMLLSPVLDSSGTLRYFVIIERDITQQLELENQIRQSQKIDMVGRLAGGVAHDFNNLLSVINGFCELSLMQVPADSDTHKNLQEIHTAGQKAATLTKQLLAFSRKQAVDPKGQDLNTIVSNMHKMLRRLIGENIELATVLNPDPCPVFIDRNELEQVIINLVVNARDAMPEGGNLIISTQRLPINSPARPTDLLLSRENLISLSIKDNGTGISQEIRPHIFEPFFTTKSSGNGTGLGLTIVKDIVARYQGDIDYESSAETGTTFRIYFPECLDLMVPPEATGPLMARGDETILLVEDDDMVRRLTGKMLLSAGYQVVEARDGPEALQMARQFPSCLGLMVTDMVMPMMSGRQLTAKIKELLPSLKILIISGYLEGEQNALSELGSPLPFLQKPFSMTILLHKVREILDTPAS